MANIGSKIKGGAYPVPAEWRRYIWRLFKPFSASHGKRGLILDPFANEGDTVLEIADHLNLEPYCVELQDQFIAPGRQKMRDFYEARNMTDFSMTRFLHEDSFKVEMSHGGFGIVFCNSPFDDQIISNVDAHSTTANGLGFYRSRVELQALDHFFKYVAPNGYMVWIAYSQHMSRKVAQTFRNNCDEIRVFRFPEPHLDHYTLVCVIGRYLGKNYKKDDDLDRQKAAEDRFIELGKNPDKIAPLDKVVELLDEKNLFAYNSIPSLNVYNGIVHFEQKRVDLVAELALNIRYGAQTLRGFAEACAPTPEEVLEQPLHRPNRRQIVVNIASGMLNNVEIVRNGKPALLRGSVRKLEVLINREQEQMINKDGSFTRIHETSLIRPDHHITLLYSDGTIEDVSGADMLEEIIKDNSDLLLENFSKRYQPFYDMKIEPVWLKVINALHPGGTGKFFKPQKYVIACTIEAEAIRNRMIANAQMGFGKTAISATAIVCLRILHLALNHKAGAALPELVTKFDINEEELIALVVNLCDRYKIGRNGMSGLRVDEPIIVGVPPIAPSIWIRQEITPLYPGFKPVQIFDASGADKFMREAIENTDSSIIHMGVISYENAKANEGREPTAYARLARGTGWSAGPDGVPKHTITVTKIALDPVSGGEIVDNKGERIPWRYFTPEQRGKSLQFFSGKELYGYESKVIDLPDGKKELRVNKTKAGQRFSIVVTRKLTRDEIDLNKSLGWPRVISRQRTLFTEVRKFGEPKAGNGRALTPQIEKLVPEHEIEQIKWKDEMGYKISVPRIAKVKVKAYTILVNDYANQKNLTDDPILDPWLASKGKRFTEDKGKADAVEKLMKKYKIDYYRIGQKKPDLDALLIKRGVKDYKLGASRYGVRNPRYPVANYLRRFWSGKIGIFIADELHTAKSNVSETANAFRDFVYASNKVLGLTGTLYGGKASSVFSLAYAFNPAVRKRYPWQRGAPLKWIEDMGVLKKVETRDVGGGNSSLRAGKKSAPRFTEAPGASPMLMRVLAQDTLWASLTDLAGKMPNKEEHTIPVKFDEDQASLYESVYATLREYNADCIVKGDMTFLAPYYQNMINLSDATHRPWTVIHNIKTDKSVARSKAAGIVPVEVMYIPALGDHLKAKEREALDCLRQDLADNRNVIISIYQTGTRDIQDRWLQIIKENVPAAKAFILRDSVKASERNDYIKKRSKEEGYNVMITNGGLIATAISITNFSVWYSIEYAQSLYTFSQATARINRPSQEREDIIYRHFFYEEDKFQKQAITNIADKTKSAAVLAGAEGGDLTAIMSSEDRVQSYQMLLDAISKDKPGEGKSNDQIQAAFQAANYSAVNWSDSAWYMPGDENDEPDTAYHESEVMLEDVTEEETEDVELDIL